MALDAALRSADPRVETMARVLDLLTMLVPSNVALFYTVNDRMEKYATTPIVAKIEHSRLPELNHALREYRDRYAPHDPFAPRRVANGATRLATAHDLGGQEQFNRSWYARELAAKFSMTPVANLYLRAAGRFTGGITLVRDPGLPEISPSEVAVLRKAHPLFEHAYKLASQCSPRSNPGDPLRDRGLTAREREIVALIAHGASNDEISQTLQITRATVKKPRQARVREARSRQPPASATTHHRRPRRSLKEPITNRPQIEASSNDGPDRCHPGTSIRSGFRPLARVGQTRTQTAHHTEHHETGAYSR